jgi:hypothetical protein
MLNWLSQRKFKAHLTAFLLMVLSALGMILCRWQDNSFFIGLMVVVFALANVLAIFIR